MQEGPTGINTRPAMPVLHALAAAEPAGTSLPGNLGDLLHGADQHPYTVAQQARVSWIVDIGLHHRGIHAHPPDPGQNLLKTKQFADREFGRPQRRPHPFGKPAQRPPGRAVSYQHADD